MHLVQDSAFHEYIAWDIIKILEQTLGVNNGHIYKCRNAFWAVDRPEAAPGRGPARAQLSRSTGRDRCWTCEEDVAFLNPSLLGSGLVVGTIRGNQWELAHQKTWRNPRELAGKKEKTIAWLPLRASRGTQIMQQKHKAANEKSMQTREKWWLVAWKTLVLLPTRCIISSLIKIL